MTSRFHSSKPTSDAELAFATRQMNNSLGRVDSLAAVHGRELLVGALVSAKTRCLCVTRAVKDPQLYEDLSLR